MPHAADCAACAYAGYEYIHLAAGVRPYLLTCGTPVCVGVGGIDELPEDNCAGDLLAQLLGACYGTFHPFGSGCQFELCAVGFEQVPALNGHRVGHCQDNLVSFGCSYPCESDACVTAGRLDDRSARGEYAVALGIFDHSECDAVLDTAARVEVFEFE